MVITFIGLSGCGKSYLSERIAQEKNFHRLDCDSLIEKKLESHLTAGGYSSIEGVANWMGQPYSEHFQVRQQAYLDEEKNVMEEILKTLGSDGWGLDKDFVIDTTGSVIYMNEEILSGLKKRSRIIYLGVPDSQLEFMFQQYLNEPKPVIWGDSYQPQKNESKEQTLERCYPELISKRTELYYKYADVTLIIDRENRDKFSTKRILQFAGAR